MSKHSDQVVMGFMRLSQVEQDDAVKKLREYLDAPTFRRQSIMENFRIKADIDLGPLTQGGCRCCGK